MRRTRAWAPLAAAAVTLVFAAPAAAGGLAQLDGLDGCLSFDGSNFSTPGQCAVLPTLSQPRGMALSPDGRNAYVADQNAGLVAVLERDPAGGALSPLPGLDGCISHDGTNGRDSVQRCRKGRAVSGARHLAVSPDGQSVYLTAGAGSRYSGVDAVAIFHRDPATGALTQPAGPAGCKTTYPSAQNGCGGLPDGVWLDESYDVTVSPDGSNVYVGTYSPGSAINTFTRAGDGTLSFASCIRHLNPSAGAAPPCERGFGFAGLRSITVSPDGEHVYATAGGYYGSPDWTVAAFQRRGDGSLRQLDGDAACISEAGNIGSVAGACADGRAITGAHALELSPDGDNAYVRSARGVAAFERRPDGGLVQLDGLDGCATSFGYDGAGNRGACTEVRGAGSGGFGGVAVTPDGSEVFVASEGVLTLTRDRDTGALSQPDGELGCIHEFGSSHGCADGRAMYQPYEVLASPDGRNAYVTDFGQPAASAFELLKAPVCEDSAQTVAYQSETAIPLTCTDQNGDELTLQIAEGPAHGTLGEIDQAEQTVAYRPADGFHGSDAFTFEADDGGQRSGAARVSLTVEPRPSLLGPICREVLGNDEPLCNELP